MELTKNITMLTPIDTGQAKANWFVSEGQPDDNVLRVVEGDISRTEAEQMSMDRAAALPDAPEGDVFIANNLEYVKYLEEGSSKQAPAGMVAVSVAAYIARTTNEFS